MRLIIKHYLSVLKERDELDAILPDLLLAMDIPPISRPQVGTGQLGVDIAAVGIDPKDGIKKLFLLSVKPGDLGRSDWDNASSQAVRPSLIDILETYLPTRVSPEHKELPKKIIVVVGGELKQDLQERWAQFRNKHEVPGSIEIDFWGGDQLAPLIEEHLLNENLLPSDCHKLLRKSLSFAGDHNYDLRDLYHLIDRLYVDVEGSKETKKRKCAKAIRTATLCHLIFAGWSEDEENLKHPFLSAERLVLRTWDFLRRHDLLGEGKFAEEFRFPLNCFHTSCSALFAKLQPHCHVRDGLFVRGAETVEHPARVFECIGIVSLIGLHQCYLSRLTGEVEFHIDNAVAICETLKSLINNNSISSAPSFDSHINDIVLALMLLIATNDDSFAMSWLNELIDRIAFAFNCDSGYPIATDSFEDLIAVRMNRLEDTAKLKFCSTMLPTLAEFCVIMDERVGSQLYSKITKLSQSAFKDLNFQIWHPDKTTEEFLYRQNAGFGSGITFSSIKLPDSVDEFKANVRDAMDNTASVEDFSCVQAGLVILASSSSRHFRTPPIPFIWRNPLLMKKDDIPKAETPAEEPATS